MAKGLFVSYRRDDAAHATGRIADALVSRFGRERVFVDVDSVAPGEDFVRKIEDTISQSQTFLAVIGPNWLPAKAHNGGRRIDLETDFIRLEILAALKAGIKIIPVLVDGAEMPRAESLPPDLAQLVRHNAVEVKHNTFARDLDALLARLDPPNLLQRLTQPRLLAAGGTVMAALALILTLFVGPAAPPKPRITSSVTLSEQPNNPDYPMVITNIWSRSERAADDGLIIRADFPYRERLQDEDRIDGLPFSNVVFDQRLPTLILQITNPTDAPIYVNELNFDVISATPDLQAVPVMRENPLDFRKIALSNEGWGEIQDAVLTVEAIGLPKDDIERGETRWRGRVLAFEPCARPNNMISLPAQEIRLTTDEFDFSVFDLSGILPADFDPDRQYFCALGKLSYRDPVNGQTVLEFRTRVSNRLPMMAVAAPMQSFYDLFLEHDRQGYTASVPVLLNLAPGETDTVAVNVNTDQSSVFELRQSIRLSNGDTIPGSEISLEIAIPKNRRGVFVPNTIRRGTVSTDVVERFDPDGLIQQATYDAMNRQARDIVLNSELDPQTCANFIAATARPMLQAANLPDADIYVRTEDGKFLCSYFAENEF